MADENVKESPKSEEKEPELLGMLLRDAAVVFAGLALWGGADAWATTSGLAVALVTSVGSALIAGWIIASLMHEWGHYLGAKLSRSKAPRIKAPGLLFFRYNFDLVNNSLGQFTSMSVAVASPIGVYLRRRSCCFPWRPSHRRLSSVRPSLSPFSPVSSNGQLLRARVFVRYSRCKRSRTLTEPFCCATRYTAA